MVGDERVVSGLAQPLAAGDRIRTRTSSPSGTAAALAAIGAVVFAWLLSLALVAPRPSIFPDELIYLQLQHGLATTGHFLLFGQHFSAWSYGALYPLLLSPLALVAHSPSELYRLDQIVSSLLFSTAVVPAFLLARRLLDRRRALVATALAVGVPSSLYAGHAMTESIGYPIFLWATLACWRSLETRSRRHVAGAVLACALATLTRAELVVLFPAYASAALLLHGGRRVRLGLPVLAGCALVLTLAGAALPARILGSHTALFAHLRLTAMPQWALFNLAGLELYVGVVPLCAAALLLPRWLTGVDARRRSFAAFAVAVAVWLLALIGAYVTQNPHSGVYDRYTFYLAPLAFLAFVAWLAEGSWHSLRASPVVTIVAVAVPLLIPYPRLFAGNWSGIAVNVGLLPLYVAEAITGWVGFYVLLCALLAGTSWLFLRRAGDNARLVVGAVATTLLVANLVAHAADTAISMTANTCVETAAWLDDKVPAHATIVAVGSSSRIVGRCALLETVAATTHPVRMYSVGVPLLNGLDQRVRRRADGALVSASGVPVRARYVVTSLRIRGTVLARARHGLRLYRISEPPGAGGLDAVVWTR